MDMAYKDDDGCSSSTYRLPEDLHSNRLNGFRFQVDYLVGGQIGIICE